jgi:ABC-type transport system involved in cytochrome bd biosynthesis fused ATPase/permease subunit
MRKKHFPDRQAHQYRHRPPPEHHPGSDLILVMDRERFVERGRHSELLAQCGLYAHLYDTQFNRAVRG